MSDVTQNTTNLDKLFKIKYDKRSYALFNTKTALLSKIKKSYDFDGKSLVLDNVLGFGGGVGSGTLPETNVYQQENATLTRKKTYSRIILDREAIVASKGRDAAFEAATKRGVRKGVESFVRNMSRQLFAFENGKVFEGDNATDVTGQGTTGAPYVVRGLASTWVKGFLEKGDKVYIATEGLLEITAVNYSTRDVSLVGTSATLAALSTTGGSSDPTAAKFYMQGSKDNDFTSILKTCKDTTNTSLYGLSQVTIGSRWQSAQLDAASAGIQGDLVNQIVTDVEFNTGESPDLIVTSYKQIRKLKNVMGDRLRNCVVSPRDPIFKKAGIGHTALEFHSDAGPIPLVADRMCPDDHLFALNTDYIEMHFAQAPQWFSDDGSVMMRLAGSDAYESRYGAYGDVFVHPHAQGVLYGLA
jgi:hypothetical protein